MSKNIISRLPRIANAVFCHPWMIQAEFHRSVLAPQLLAAQKNPEGYDIAYRDDGDPHARQKELNDTLCAAAPAAKWLIPPEEKRAMVAYNVDSAGLAQIYVNGVIGKALDWLDMACGGVCVDHITAALDHLAEYKPRALALHFNSPGGTVTGVAECGDAIRAFSAGVAPVHAYTDSMCASAAYWLACCADSFGAADSSVIGSIGVYCAIMDTSALYLNEGVVVHLISSGAFKGHPTSGVAVPEEYLAMRRQQCADCADRFFAAVIDGRGAQIAAEAARAGLSPEDFADSIMQGQWWYAQDGPASLRDTAHPDRRAHLGSLAL